MGGVERIANYLEPLRRAIVVRQTPEEAFAIFTERFGMWWPRHRYSIHQSDCARCGIEPGVGGEVFEISTDGRREVWARVFLWEPPYRFALKWHPGRPPEVAQEVEVRFVPVAEGTRVELEHRDWAKLGAEAAEARSSYENGWPFVLDGCFGEACR